MKILFMFTYAGVAGHTRSAITIAKELARHGHDIVFFIGGRFVELSAGLIERANLKAFVFPVNIFGRFTLRSIISMFKLAQKEKFDVIHVFIPLDLLHGFLLSKILKVPLILTICGGKPPPLCPPYVTRIIVFSKELEDYLLCRSKFNDSYIKVCPARMDVREFDTFSTIAVKTQKEVTDIIQICRIGRVKLSGLMFLLKSFEIVRQRGHEAILTIIGQIEDKESSKKLRQEAERINSLYGRDAVRILSKPEEILRPRERLLKADIVVGMARSAFEGMLYAKPTLIVGAYGFAGLVQSGNIDSLAYYNFSGRNVRSERGNVNQLADEIEKLILNRQYRIEASLFVRNWAEEYLDVSKAKTLYEDIYQAAKADYLSWLYLYDYLRYYFLNYVLMTGACVKRFLRAYLKK